MLVLVNALNESGQIEIILAEQQAHRMYPPHPGGVLVGAGISQLHYTMFPDGLTQIPKPVHKPLAMVRSYIVKTLVSNQLLYRLQILHRRTAGHQLIEDWVQLLIDKRTALQQDFANGQHLAFGQLVFGGFLQTVAIRLSVIDQIRASPKVVAPQGFEVSLDRFLGYPKLHRTALLVQ